MTLKVKEFLKIKQTINEQESRTIEDMNNTRSRRVLWENYIENLEKVKEK